MDTHAQFEIRSYATVIGNDIVRRWCPLAWEAFIDYRVNALILTPLERQIVWQLTQGQTDAAMNIAKQAGLLQRTPTGLKRNRERQELVV